MSTLEDSVEKSMLCQVKPSNIVWVHASVVRIFWIFFSSITEISNEVEMKKRHTVAFCCSSGNFSGDFFLVCFYMIKTNQLGK